MVHICHYIKRLTCILLISMSGIETAVTTDTQLNLPNPKCREFSVVNEEQQEFYSPQYPGNYSSHLDCILNITAAFGYQIRLDFRDYFQLEPSEDCANDFLEIRDGPHGYSDKLGKFCGSEFPPIITSRDRHLWLRFRSDESLEYKGFRAVYKFTPNPGMTRPEIEACLIPKTGVQGVVQDTDIPPIYLNYSLQYTLALECTWRIEVEPGHKIYLFFENFKLSKPNECDQNYVDLFEGKRDMSSILKHYCGSAADAVTTKGTNLLFFRYYSIKAFLKSEFKAYFTSQRDILPDGDTEDHCTKEEYDCEDATCIDLSLRCNGVKNCRHQYDEEGCDDSTKEDFDISSQHIVFILILGCTLLSGMCFATCYNCIKKLVKDGRTIHENIRRSREQLEERRSASLASFPKSGRGGSSDEDDVDCFIEGQANGHTCVNVDEDLTDDTDDEELDEDIEESVEMRDCECQTRDSIMNQRSQNRTPPPPPPPLRRPPDAPPLSPLVVPTPPPPPSHYNRHGRPLDPYGGSFSPASSSIRNFERNESSNDIYPEKYRSAAAIQMRDQPPRHDQSKPAKTPDVLVTH